MYELATNIYSYVTSHALLYSLSIFVLFFIIAKTGVFIAERVILRLTKKTKTNIDDLIVERTNRPLSIIILLVGLRLAIMPLGLSEKVTNYSELALYALIVLLVARIAAIIVNILIDNWGKKWAERTKSTMDDHLISLFNRFSRFVLYIIAALVIIESFGVEIGPLLASLGIAGIAVAFALQSSLANIFGGVSLIIDKSIKVGDKIQLDADTVGEVYDIGLRSTKIKTYNNEIVIMPNGKLADSRIINHALPDETLRVAVQFSAAYGTDVRRLEKVILSEIRKVSHFIKEPEPFVRFEAMGDSALMFKVFFWIDTYKEHGLAVSEANALIYKALAKNKIEIPFPQKVVHIKK